MTQGDERMKAAKASIRQRLTHSKLPMLVLVGVVLFALIFLGMRFFTRYTREELYSVPRKPESADGNYVANVREALHHAGTAVGFPDCNG